VGTGATVVVVTGGAVVVVVTGGIDGAAAGIAHGTVNAANESC
jgi:hypothetical protein